ncbi:MAG: hypothetical protein HXY48_10595 [Ignavibacteriaceae bacterium]|nr:hypothetical protein [Ignavibacteriaceae bacterium]
MKNLFIVTIILIIFSGCGEEVKQESVKLTTNKLSEIVNKAIDGDSAAVSMLPGLFNLSISPEYEYSKVEIDSFNLENSQVFVVLLENPNPFFNRFAVYDSNLLALLIDKSLNGNLSVELKTIGQKRFFVVAENFFVKDDFKLRRISLYSAKGKVIQPVFRTLTCFSSPSGEYWQSISEVTDKLIRTSITATNQSVINNLTDEFVFDNSTGIYKSSSDLFLNYISGEIESYNKSFSRKLITDEKSFLSELGVKKDITGNNRLSTSDMNSFSMTLDSDWKELKDISVSKNLKKELRGVKFLNNKIGANFTVIRIPFNESAEAYVNYELKYNLGSRYNIRYSDTIISGKSLYVFYEYSCSDKKFLIMFEASQYTFKKYEDYYLKIINSISIDC